MSGDSAHRTSDMTLVAYLATVGINNAKMELSGDLVVWVLPASGALSRELAKYERGDCRVEPGNLMRQVVRVRTAMFQFKERAQRVA